MIDLKKNKPDYILQKGQIITSIFILEAKLKNGDIAGIATNTKGLHNFKGSYSGKKLFFTLDRFAGVKMEHAHEISNISYEFNMPKNGLEEGQRITGIWKAWMGEGGGICTIEKPEEELDI